MPLAQSITLAVDPPDGSDLAPTTINTGLMATDTAVTATFAVPVMLSGVLADSLGNEVPGARWRLSAGALIARNEVASTTTASDGSFSVSVSPGTYDVLIDPWQTPPIHIRTCTARLTSPAPSMTR